MKRGLGISLSFLLVTFLVSSLQAAELTISPGVRFSSVYDDNLYLQDKSDAELMAAPTLKIQSVGERTKWQLQSRGEFYQYLKYDEFNRFDQVHSLDLTHQMSQLVSLTVSGGYTRDHSFDQLLQQEGVITDKIVRNLYRVSPGLLFNLTERDTLNVSYLYLRNDYDDATTFDYTSNGAVAVYEHKFKDGKTSTYTHATYQKNIYDRTADADKGDENLFMFMQGLRYRFSELWQAQVGMGVSYLDGKYKDEIIEFDTATGIRSTRRETTNSSHVGFIGEALVKYTAPQTYFEAGYDRALSESVLGGTVASDSIHAGIEYNIDERWGLNLYGRIQRTETQIDGYKVANTKNLYTSIRPAVRYRLTEDLLLRLYYDRFDRIDIDDQEPDQTTGRNRFGLEIQWDYPLKRTF